MVDHKIINYMKKNIQGMLSAKMGGIIVTGTDNLLLSYYVGLTSVAMYSNYTMITTGLTQVMTQMISAVSSSIGNLGASKDSPKKKERVFYQYLFLSSLVSFVVSVGFAGFSSAFVGLWVGKKMVYTMLPLICISVNFFLQNLRQSVINYTNAYGLYWYARWKPVFESLVNFGVSWSLVKFTNLDIAGVLIGTIASNLLVNLIWEPLIVMRYGLKAPLGRMLRLYFAYTIFGTVYILGTAVLVERLQLITLTKAVVGTSLLEIIGVAIFLVVNIIWYPHDVEMIRLGPILNRFRK
jgi:O-antigen/teichoic acid export membrane protein